MSTEFRPPELATRRKEISDAKNQTQDLTFSDSYVYSSHGEAAKAVRELKEDIEMKRLENYHCNYFDNLL